MNVLFFCIQLCVESILKKHTREFEQKYMQDKETDPEDGVSASVKSNIDIKQEYPAKSKSSDSGIISAFDKSPSAFYNEMYEYFGDSLSMQLPEMPELKCIVFKPVLKEVTVSLADPETNKSGEELLDEFMEQVKIEEEIEKIRKEQERLAREKWEREELARLEKIRSDYDKRMADHRQQMQLAYQQRAEGQMLGSDEEIDIEGDNGADNSDKSEEEVAGAGAGDIALAVKSTVSGPGQGIKLTITKRPRLTLNLKQSTPSPHSSHQQKDSKETKPSRKRKQSFSELFDFEDISDYEAGPSYTSTTFYSSEGEASSDGGSGRKALTLKLRKHEPPSD